MPEEQAIKLEDILKGNPHIDLQTLLKRRAYLAKLRGMHGKAKKGYGLAPRYGQRRVSTSPKEIETRTIHLHHR